MNTRIMLLLAALSGCCLAVELSLPSVFSDHMVLQRDRAVPVWGKTAPGAEVTVEFAGQTKTATAGDDGTWRTALDSMPASSESREFTVSAGDQKVAFQNVLVGEVWLCSGQSNMKMPMIGLPKSSLDNSAAEIAAADHPRIRLYLTPTAASATPTDRINAAWAVCTPETIGKFSATAYYFGRKLQQELDVPIGLILSAVGGTRIEPWTPPCGFEGIESLKAIQQIAQNMPELQGKHRQTPTSLYNSMLHAHIPFAIRGAIWYQGESNHNDGMLYVDKTRALLNGWRKLWGYDFPFYFVQIAPFKYGEDNPGILPSFWEAQAEIVKVIPNTGMVVINDVSTLDNIHPSNKEAPGTRLALLALDNTYDQDIVSTGPVFQTLEKQNGALKLIFDSAEGLTTRDGKSPDWFEVAGADGIFKPAEAVIDGSSIRVQSGEVTDPITVRFAWHKLATPNLMNGAGLPASAFRAGL